MAVKTASDEVSPSILIETLRFILAGCRDESKLIKSNMGVPVQSSSFSLRRTSNNLKVEL